MIEVLPCVSIANHKSHSRTQKKLIVGYQSGHFRSTLGSKFILRKTGSYKDKSIEREKAVERERE